MMEAEVRIDESAVASIVTVLKASADGASSHPTSTAARASKPGETRHRCTGRAARGARERAGLGLGLGQSRPGMGIVRLSVGRGLDVPTHSSPDSNRAADHRQASGPPLIGGSFEWAASVASLQQRELRVLAAIPEPD